MTEYVPMLVGVLGLLGGAVLWLHARGKAEGKAEAKLEAATADLVRISSIPTIEGSILSLSSTMKRNHEENRERLDKTDAKIDKLVSQHAQLKSDIASLEGRKVSVRELRVPSRHEWNVDEEEPKR